MDLELASTDELIAELKKRFDEFIVVGRKDITDLDEHSICDWKGGMHCISLGNLLIHTVLMARDRVARGADDEGTEIDAD